MSIATAPATEVPKAEETAEKNCLNCGTPLTDAFCPHCGQRATVGRLTLKSVLVDNAWSAIRMDKGVLPTAALLLTRPWVVIRNYIYGQRVRYTQPVRFIVIMCFVNIMAEMLFPGVASSAKEEIAGTAPESFWPHLWWSVRAFLADSEVAKDLIDSIIFAPVVWLVYRPWGSNRFNFAEYSTAYIYLCGGWLALSLLLLPVAWLNRYVPFVIQIVWGIYILNGLVKHAFHIRKLTVRMLALFINLLLILFMAILSQSLLF